MLNIILITFLCLHTSFLLVSAMTPDSKWKDKLITGQQRRINMVISSCFAITIFSIIYVLAN